MRLVVMLVTRNMKLDCERASSHETVILFFKMRFIFGPFVPTVGDWLFDGIYIRGVSGAKRKCDKSFWGQNTKMEERFKTA